MNETLQCDQQMAVLDQNFPKVLFVFSRDFTKRNVWPNALVLLGNPAVSQG